MNTVLLTAYAVSPVKGSEDAMGWNSILQAARHHQVIAVTRKNNRSAIESFFSAHGDYNELAGRIKFLYFDWPQWMLFWKKGPMLSMIYYYAWQLCLALWLKKKNLQFDIAHNLNFHNDWTPSFLWILGKPFIWGPVGHHPLIPKPYSLTSGRTQYIKDRMLWMTKLAFWHLDPFLAICKRKAAHTLCMHSGSVKQLGLKHRYEIYPSVAAEPVSGTPGEKEGFTVLSVGRFVPLKGFDITIRAFDLFRQALDKEKQEETRLIIVGKGPQKEELVRLIKTLHLEDAVQLIDWMPRSELDSLYRKASVFLFPSHEGAGMVVAEAMRYGLPVVCWNNYGPGELTHPDSTLKVDYSLPEKDIPAFGDQLLKLYEDDSCYSRESSYALRRFEHLLSWELRGQKFKSVYETALKTSGASLLNLAIPPTSV